MASAVFATGTFAAACGVDAKSAGVVILAPPHPTPDQHTIVSRFPASLQGLASAVQKDLREKGVLPSVRVVRKGESRFV